MTRNPFARPSALACLFVLSCAHETPERPLPSTAEDHTHATSPAASSLPFPDTAFTSDAKPQSRFETTTIGRSDVEARSEFRSRHRGAPIDLDVKGADLANVFRLIAEVGHVSIVMAGEISGTVTLRLRHVPWEQALEVIARAKNLDLEFDGNVILVRSAGAAGAGLPGRTAVGDH